MSVNVENRLRTMTHGKSDILSPCLMVHSPSPHLSSLFPHSILCFHIHASLIYCILHNPCSICNYFHPIPQSLHSILCSFTAYFIVHNLFSTAHTPSPTSPHHFPLFLSVPMLHSILYTPVSLPHSPFPPFPPHPLCISHSTHTLSSDLHTTHSVPRVLQPAPSSSPVLLTSQCPFSMPHTPPFTSSPPILLTRHTPMYTSLYMSSSI